VPTGVFCVTGIAPGCRLRCWNRVYEKEQYIVMTRERRSHAQVIPGLVIPTAAMRSEEEVSVEAAQGRAAPHLVRIPEAARITGLPRSLFRKSFMTAEKRPKNVPLPPPHRRIGRAVYILANELPAWIESLGDPCVLPEKRRRGRPTVAERIMRRKQDLA
jgi:hypothetical protein